jgi:MFS transporter, putative metabolite:H+ symporter
MVAGGDDVPARLERLPSSRWHLRIRLLIGAVTFFEGFDQLAIAYTLPSMTAEWSLSPAAQTLAVTSGSVGMLLGALVSGLLADRIGRVNVVGAALSVTALSCMGLAFCPNFGVFLALRFVQGLGIGGEVPAAATYIGELAQSARRGRFVLFYELVFPAGLAAVAIVSAWVVPSLGWRWLYGIGVLPALLVGPILRWVPESPRWLAASGRGERAALVTDHIERAVRRSTGRPLPPVVAISSAPSVRRRYLRRTIVVGLLWLLSYFANYGVATWLPTIYTDRFGLSLSAALTYSVATSVAGLLGAVAIALLADRIGRRACLAGGSALAAVMFAVLAAFGVSSAEQVLVLSALGAVFVFAVNLGLYLYAPELYPTMMRAAGASLGAVWNRVGVIVGPLLVGTLAAASGLPAVFAMLSVVMVGAAVTAVLAEETRGRTLEEISP